MRLIDSAHSRRELRVRLAQQQAVAHLGQLALTDAPREALLDEAVRLVAAELQADYASVVELLPDGSAFAIRACIGWALDPQLEPIRTDLASQSGYTLASSEAVIMLDTAAETRFAISAQMQALGVRSGISTCIGSNGGTYGVLGAHTNRKRTFSAHDVTFLDAVATVLASALGRRAAEEEAEKTHRVLEAVIDGTTDSVFVKDLEGRFVTVNEPAARVLGRSRAELIGRTLHEVLPSALAETMAASDRLVLDRATTETFEEVVSFESAPRVYLTTKGPYRGRDGELLGTFGIARDITARDAQQRDLRIARDYADRLIETSNAIVLVLDLEHNIQTFNKAAEEITGYGRDEVLGRNWDMLVPRDRYPEPWVEYERLVASEGADRYENPILTKDGAERLILWRNSQLLDQQGSVAGTVSFGIDVTEVTAAKERAESLEERLRQAEKLEALGQLAGGVAHDFNNLLLAIRGYGETALSGLEQGAADVADNIATMMSACDQAAGLTKQLLAFGRRQVLIPQVLDLNDVVEETVALLARLIGENVEIVSLLADEPVLVNADRGQIAQVITNLAINARDAMQEGGVMTIRVGTEARDDAPGRLAVLGVSDDGCGIDAATAARIFEPFFTTKGEDGNGLGLATVYGIVAQSGGEIKLETDVGRGTTFTVFLPLCDEDLPALAPVPVIGEARGTETILLVEDDPTVRSIVSTMLAAHGYKVVSAASGSEALELFAASDESIQVVVSDLIMHGLSGRQTIDAIRAQAPATKALYMSGYTNDFTIRSGTLDPGTGFIQKPFSGVQLAGAVRQLLDAGPIRRIA